MIWEEHQNVLMFLAVQEPQRRKTVRESRRAQNIIRLGFMPDCPRIRI